MIIKSFMGHNPGVICASENGEKYEKPKFPASREPAA
jgi:hypothetical protein